MRASLAALLAAMIAATQASAATSSGTALRVTYWPDSANRGETVTWTVRCDPAGGTLQRPARACRKLAVGGVRLFAPTPKNTACTELYGGPQRARVVGTVTGKRVWATFTRVNGCEIARWQRISPWLVPRGGVG